MKKFFSKIICSALVVSSIIAFSSSPALASDVPTTKDGFIPSEDSTWGDLYRHFDPEGFATLSPEEKKIYDSTLLGNNTATPASTNTNDVISEFMEAHGMENYVSASSIIRPTKQSDTAAPSPLISLEVANFAVATRPSTNSIDYAGIVVCTIPCPVLGMALTLYNEDGIYVDFNADSEEDAMIFGINDTFDGLESKTTYQVHALVLLTPPPGYTAAPASLLQDCTTQ